MDLSTLLWGPRTWRQGTNLQRTSTSGRMKLCISKKEPFTFMWGTRNAICTREERYSFRRIPGDEFATHKHLGQDEIVYIEKGTVHVHVGDQERDLHAGGTVFIPAYTWVSVTNAGTETVKIVVVFAA